jgi:hypothetical protein
VPRGAVCVAGGALKLRPPRLPAEEPDPARASASVAEAKPKLKPRRAAKKIVETLRYADMGSILVTGQLVETFDQYGTGRSKVQSPVTPRITMNLDRIEPKS